MQATLSVDDELLRRAKEEALRLGTTLSAIVEAALREKLRSEERKPRVAFELPVFHPPDGKGGLRAGLTWEELPYLDDDSSPW